MVYCLKTRSGKAVNGNSGSRRRALAEVVTIDAWTAPFSNKNRRVDLRSDVTFGVARIGNEEDSPVGVWLSINRADKGSNLLSAALDSDSSVLTPPPRS